MYGSGNGRSLRTRSRETSSTASTVKPMGILACSLRVEMGSLRSSTSKMATSCPRHTSAATAVPWRRRESQPRACPGRGGVHNASKQERPPQGDRASDDDSRNVSNGLRPRQPEEASCLDSASPASSCSSPWGSVYPLGLRIAGGGSESPPLKGTCRKAVGPDTVQNLAAIARWGYMRMR
jgi:hypothetical protein